MCTGAEVAMVGLAVGAYSADQQRQAGKAGAAAQRQGALAAATEAYTNAELAKIDAERIKKSSVREADTIREAAIAIRGQQEAVQATSGTMVGIGSNAIVTEDTTKKAEADALATVMEGLYGRLNKEASARYASMAGGNALLSGALSARASVISGNANAVATLGNSAMSAFTNYKLYK